MPDAKVELVKLVRSEPLYPGGPVEMMSHPEEVATNLEIGWEVAAGQKAKGQAPKAAKQEAAEK